MLIRRAQERLHVDTKRKMEKEKRYQAAIEAQASLIQILEDESSQSDVEQKPQESKQLAVLQEVRDKLERTKAENRNERKAFRRALSVYKSENREIFEGELQSFKKQRLKIQREVLQHKFERLHRQRAAEQTGQYRK
jgi:hypothetical protein